MSVELGWLESTTPQKPPSICGDLHLPRLDTITSDIARDLTGGCKQISGTHTQLERSKGDPVVCHVPRLRLIQSLAGVSSFFYRC